MFESRVLGAAVAGDVVGVATPSSAPVPASPAPSFAGPSSGLPEGCTVADCEQWADRLAAVALGGTKPTPDSGGAGDPAGAVDLINLIAALERVKAAACAAQARAAVELDQQQRAAHRAAGLPAGKQGAGVGAQVALARGQSPHAGAKLLGLARALIAEMPETFGALASGTLDEWRATVVVRESACLSVADRLALDAEIAGDRRTLDGVGPRRLAGQARRVAQRLDAASVVRRARRAEGERCVTIRPAPDTMVYLTALLPVAQGVAAYAALSLAADTARSAPADTAGGRAPRSRGQVMADTLVERLTGQRSAEAVHVGVNLVMTETALLAPAGTPGRQEPAHIAGHGPVPAAWARDLVARALGDPAPAARGEAPGGVAPGGGPGGSAPGVDRASRAWFRRLFTHPSSGQLVALESRARTAPAGLRDFIDLRDDACRTPWCDAPIRHSDHAVDHERGGPTSSDNLQGLCEACNYTKSLPGWSAEPRIEGVPGDLPHTVLLTTPTFHTYVSTSPPVPGARVTPSVARVAPPAAGPKRGKERVARARRGEERVARGEEPVAIARRRRRRREPTVAGRPRPSTWARAVARPEMSARTPTLEWP